MKKIISFSLFATIVILVLAANNTAVAQNTRPRVSRAMVRTMCPRAGYRWGRAFPVYGPRHFKPYAVRLRARPMRRGKFS